METAILSTILEGDPDLTNYLSKLLRTNKPEEQNNTFCFSEAEKPGKTEDHSPIQTLILKKLGELQEGEKLNRNDEVDLRMNFVKRFYWTDTLLTGTEKTQWK